MKEEEFSKDKNINTKSIPCIDCLILPICIQRTKPPSKPGEIKIPPFLSPLIRTCELFHAWFASGPFLVNFGKTSTDQCYKIL